MNENIVVAKRIYKSYGDKQVLDGLNLTVDQGDFVVIYGKSGSGKSTFLNILGMLEECDSGYVSMFGMDEVKPFTKKAEFLLRNKIGYLFQNFALIDNKTVKYNLNIAMKHSKSKNQEDEIKKALEFVGLSGFQDKLVFKCSGGEQQRIAIARLLLKPCELVLCDEPTGSLDNENKEMIFDLLTKMNQEGKTLIVVSHDLDLAKRANKVIEI